MTITPLRIPDRFYGQPIPVAPDMNQVVDKVDELVAAVNAGLATSNAIVGGDKYVRYLSSQTYGVPADALTLDRLDRSTVLPGTMATVINPHPTPLTVTAASAYYRATIVPAGTADAVLVPAFTGSTDTVPVVWLEIESNDTFTPLLKNELALGKDDYAGLALRPLLIALVNGIGTGSSTVVTQPPITQPTTGPTVTGFLPDSAEVGASITLTGTGFAKATAVLFNGTPASFQLINATTLVAVVPAGATTGPLAVTNSAGTGTSAASFTVKASTTAPTPGDTVKPDVYFTVPAPGATLPPNTQITLTAIANDNVGVAGLNFTNGATGAAIGPGAKNGNTYTFPYTTGSAGPLSLVATATDAAGNSQSATVNATVQGATAPAPSQALTAALAISVASIMAGTPLTFEVTAGGGTEPYSYAVKATNNATGAVTILGSSATGSFTPQTGGTSYNIDATVTDAAGNTKPAQTRTVQVSSPQSVNQLPVVSVGDHLTITAPTNSAVLMATASDPDPGDTLTYLWRPVTGPSGAPTVTGLPAATLNAVVGNLTVAGEYLFGFQATDQKGGKSQEGFVAITVNAAPAGGGGNGESFTVGQGDFAFTTYDLNKGAYWQRSAQARIGFDTDATSLEFGVQAILGATYPSIQAAEHLLTITDVNGNFVNHLLPATTSGEQTLSVTGLPGSGVRRFYITEPENTQNGATDFIGTYLTRVKRLNGSILQRAGVVRTPNRVVVSGDSISVGNGASNTSRYAWVVRLRQLLGAAWEVANTGWGAAYAGGRFNTAALQQAEAKRVVSYFAGATGVKKYIDALGTNDFWYVPGDPATIAAYKAGVWDEIHKLDPTIKIYSGTPLWRGNKDTPNSLGKVLADYATAFNAAAQARIAYVTAVDCLPWLTAADFTQANTGIPVDNLHPNDTGQYKKAQRWYGYVVGQSIAANLQQGEVVQEDDPRITYGGAWRRNDYSPESYLFRLGALRYTNSYGATAAIPTDGTQIRFGTYTEATSGIFELLYNSIVIATYSLAGPQQRIDIYSPVVVPAGNRKFLVRKRDNDGSNVYLDEIEVTDGTFTPTPSLPNGTGGGTGGGTGVTVDYEENSPVWTNANGFNMGNGAAYAAVSSQPYYEWDGFPGGTAVFESAADPAGGKVDVLVDNVVIMTWTQNGSGRATSSPKLLPSGTLRVQPSTSGAGSYMFWDVMKLTS